MFTILSDNFIPNDHYVNFKFQQATTHIIWALPKKTRG